MTSFSLFRKKKKKFNEPAYSTVLSAQFSLHEREEDGIGNVLGSVSMYMGGARVLGIHTTFREVLSSELKGQFQKVLKSCHSRPAPALPRPTSFRFVFFFFPLLHIKVENGKPLSNRGSGISVSLWSTVSSLRQQQQKSFVDLKWLGGCVL